jgi:hypothetical protein
MLINGSDTQFTGFTWTPHRFWDKVCKENIHILDLQNLDFQKFPIHFVIIDKHYYKGYLFK